MSACGHRRAAGEQVGVLDRLVPAGRGNQPFHLVYRQIVSFPSACLGSLMAGKQVHRVGGIAISVMDKLEQNYDEALALFAGAFLFSRYPCIALGLYLYLQEVTNKGG